MWRDGPPAQAGIVGRSISGPLQTRQSAPGMHRPENLGHRSGEDWGIGHAGKGKEA